MLNRQDIIGIFAEEIALKEKDADYHYYIKSDQQKSSRILEDVQIIANLAGRLGITQEVYKQAYKIYDFRDSGKKEFTLQKTISLTEMYSKTLETER